ncbi:MAG TPA: Na+/H+ antiporter NhaA [Gammaproteobacteria bacterium]
MANSPWRAAYQSIWQAEPTHLVVNDGLMSVFFLVVGLEIRRALHEGALSTLHTAALPLIAALGGIVVPAAIYLALNARAEPRGGWAIPTATDIAFAVGALALLGRRAAALRVLLLALAVADDLAAILIIAFFYADGAVDLRGATLAASAIGALIAARFFGAQRAPTYLVIALANAGIAFTGVDFYDELSASLVAGIVLALLVGKPVGIVGATALGVRLGWCRLPPDVSWSDVAVMGCIGGIGFTMSIFIATLAFPDPTLLAAAKFAVIAASALALVTALVISRSVKK